MEISFAVGIAFSDMELCELEVQGEKKKIPKEKKMIRTHSNKSQRFPKDRNNEATISTFQYNTNEDERPRSSQIIKSCQKNSISKKANNFLAINTV